MVDIEELTKRYGKFVALDHMNLHIDKGEIFGFVGPNGAGKTTVFNLLTGVYKPDSGKVLLDGKDLSNGGSIDCETDSEPVDAEE